MPLQHTINRIYNIGQFELIRLFFTKSGLMTLLAFLTTWLIILYYPINSAVDIISSGAFEDVAYEIFGALGLRELLNWPVAELAMYWLVAVYSFPLFALIISSDQTCADRERGTLRFISLRATRFEIVMGRFLGQVVIMALLIMLTLLASILLAGIRDATLIAAGVIIAFKLFIQLFIVVLPFIALMTFINSFTKSAKLSLVYCVLFFGLVSSLFALLQYLTGFGNELNYLIPGMQVSDILNPETQDSMSYIIPIFQTIFYVTAGQLIMSRSSL